MVKPLLVTCVTCASLSIHALDDSLIKSIKINGVRHVNAQVIEDAIELKRGDQIHDGQISVMIKNLYATGMFSDVKIQEENGSLIIHVKENPIIKSITHKGVSLIPDEKFDDLLEQMKLVKGQYFQEMSYSDLSNQIKQLYDSMGYFNAAIMIDRSLDEKSNTITIAIKVIENKQPTIQKIEIRGNDHFSTETLVSMMSLKTNNLISHLFKEDRYAKQKMDADLALVRSYYLDHGFMEIQVEDLIVSLTPDKQSIYIMIELKEGHQSKLAGQRLKYVGFDESSLLEKDQSAIKHVLKQETSAYFNRTQLIQNAQSIKQILGDSGYAYAEVSPVPVKVGHDEVEIVYEIKPGKTFYVRKINFSGNSVTNTNALRRYINQMEFSPYSSEDLKVSQQRLSQLKWIKNIDMTMDQVMGEEDLVDINFDVEEQSSAQIMLEASYSPNTSFSFGFSFLNDNFLGTGKSFSIATNKSKSNLSFNVSYSNPFFTEAGTSQSISLFHSKTKPGRLELTDYVRNSTGASLHYGHPLSDFFRMYYGASIETNKLVVGDKGSLEVNNFVNNYGYRHATGELNLAFVYNTFNSGMWPSKGLLLSASGSAHKALDENKINYFKSNLSTSFYYPLTKGFITNAKASVSFADKIKNDGVVPFYEYYHAGGIGTVAGYESYSLGPKDSEGRSYGGQLQTLGSLNLIIPTNLGDTVRTSVFLNAGNVFDHDFELDELRYSYGASLTWLTILGPLEFVIAKPINKKEGDELSSFDFTISAGV